MLLLYKPMLNNTDVAKPTLLTVAGITLHDTAVLGQKKAGRWIGPFNPPDPEIGYQSSNGWNKPGQGDIVDAHGCIGEISGGRVAVVMGMPYLKGQAVRADHCGGTANSHFLGIEVCEDSDANPKSDLTYVKACWDTAVEFFAAMCREHGFKPWDKLTYKSAKTGKTGTVYAVHCHKEVSTAWGETNHSDPYDWLFPKLKKNMDDFRNEVQNALNMLNAPSPLSTPRTYTVIKGDTLSAIALRMLGKSSRYPEIIELNGLKNDIIRIGQVLKIPPMYTDASAQ